MKLPRDISGTDLAKSLRRAFDYEVTRQAGSHLRLTTQRNGEHSITVPRHDRLKIGTLSAILNDVADHFRLTREEVAKRLFE